MTESEFLTLLDQTLLTIERELEALSQSTTLDIDVCRNGNSLELECENGSKIVISSQIALREIWVATKAGGFHYRYDKAQWINFRDNEELFQSLSRYLSEQSGQAVQIMV